MLFKTECMKQLDLLKCIKTKMNSLNYSSTYCCTGMCPQDSLQRAAKSGNTCKNIKSSYSSFSHFLLLIIFLCQAHLIPVCTCFTIFLLIYICRRQGLWNLPDSLLSNSSQMTVKYSQLQSVCSVCVLRIWKIKQMRLIFINSAEMGSFAVNV